MSLKNELDLDMQFEDIRHEAMLGVVHTAGLAAGAASKIFRQFDLTEAQFNVLFALKYKTRTLSQVELGRRLVVTRATVTSVLDKLESKGFIERQIVPENRRIYHVELTEEGHDLVGKVEPYYRESVHYALKDLNETDLHAIMDLMDKIRENLRELISKEDDDGKAPGA